MCGLIPGLAGQFKLCAKVRDVTNVASNTTQNYCKVFIFFILGTAACIWRPVMTQQCRK